MPTPEASAPPPEPRDRHAPTGRWAPPRPTTFILALFALTALASVVASLLGA